MGRHRIPAVLLLVVTAFGGLAGAHTGAHTGDAWPLLASVHAPAGWASFKIRTDAGGAIAFQIHSGGFTNPVSHALALYDDNDQFISAIAFGAYYSSIYGVRVHSLDGPGGPLTVNQEMGEYSNAQGGGGFTPVITPPTQDSVTYKVLVWAAAKDLKSWSVDVHAQSGELLGEDSGTGGFIYLTNDFTGTGQVRGEVLGAGGRASIGLHKTIQVKDRMFGWFMTGSASNADLLSVGTPTRVRDCPVPGSECDFFRSGENDGPGIYDFRITGAGAHALVSGHEVTLMGVDARLPA